MNRRGVYVALVNVGDFLAEKLVHARLVELLEAVQQFEMAVVSHAFPVKIQVVWIFHFIHELAEEEVDELVEGVFPA